MEERYTWTDPVFVRRGLGSTLKRLAAALFDDAPEQSAEYRLKGGKSPKEFTAFFLVGFMCRPSSSPL